MPKQYSLNNQSLTTELLKLGKITKELVLQWIPGHVELEGNEIAHSLAKTGGRQNQTDSSLHPKEIKTILKRNESERCQYNHKSDPYFKLLRHFQNIIFRLRTGHNRLKQLMFRKLRIGASQMCPRRTAPENAEHVLQTYPLYHSNRSALWPQATTLIDKLHGRLEQLITAAQFVTNIGLV